MWGNIAIAFLLAFIVSFMVTPYTMKLSEKIGAIDVPKDNRRMRKKSIPLLGGLAVITGFLISLLYLVSVMNFEGSLELFDENLYLKKLIGIGIGLIIITFTGIIDDTKGLKPYKKLFGQIIAAIFAVAFGLIINDIEIPFISNLGFSYEFSIFITIFWIVGITNAINFIDGLDGLSSGIALISCISLLIIFALNQAPIIAILIITSLIGALVGFLPFNFSPAKTFIGDTGSNALGYILAVVSILGVAKTYTTIVIALPILVLGLPILDVAWAIIRRTIKGKSIKAIFQADKGHLHHRLVARGFSQKQAVLILYTVSAALGVSAIIILESGIWKALSFILMVIAALFLGYKNFLNKKDEIGVKYECAVCKYIYNPKFGNEKAGIGPGTEFKDLPEDWVCPVCGEKKNVFEVHR